MNTIVRQAILKDQQQIANLMFFETHVHRHLDWCSPLEWLGSSFYWVIEHNRKISAALACPQDPPQIAWVRLFAHAGYFSLQETWETLWERANFELNQQGGATVAVIALQTWYQILLSNSSFQNHQQVVTLEWSAQTAPKWEQSKGVQIRPMTPDDLPHVVEVDNAAFNPLWRNSILALNRAYPQAIVATIAETDAGLVGYQISTQNPFGAHLARLAVRPDVQRRGLGSALVNDLITRLVQCNVHRLTVNTQDDNQASLALYQKIGFVRTGEQYPVFEFSIPAKTI